MEEGLKCRCGTFSHKRTKKKNKMKRNKYKKLCAKE